jgi:hypothetical protein
MVHFRWNGKRERAALALASGKTDQQAADEAGSSRQSIQRWKHDPDFASEVDRLTLLTGISQRAERLRIAMQAVRQKLKDDGTVRTERDLLDWLKFAQGETDGFKLDLDAFTAALGASTGDDARPCAGAGGANSNQNNVA